MVQMNYLLLVLVVVFSCGCERKVRIAVVPRTTGAMLWEAERDGASAAAEKLGFEIYWNAPTREDDIEGQIALLERIRRERFDGVVLAPDQARALMTPVRKMVEANIPTVIVSSPLPLASQAGLNYLVNDDEETGTLAARRLGQILHGKGSVGLLSLDPNLLGLMAQVRAFETTLGRDFPGIEIVDRRLGAFNGAEAQQITADLLVKHQSLSALVSFTAVATRGAFLALRAYGRQRDVKLIGCEQDADIIEAIARDEIDSIIAENTYDMGYAAINAIAAYRRGVKEQPRVMLRPLLVVKENIDSPELKKALRFGWSNVPPRKSAGAAFHGTQ